MFFLTTLSLAPSRVAGTWTISSTYLLNDSMTKSQANLPLQPRLGLCSLDQPQKSRVSELKLTHTLAFNPSTNTAVGIIHFQLQNEISVFIYSQ